MIEVHDGGVDSAALAEVYDLVASGQLGRWRFGKRSSPYGRYPEYPRWYMPIADDPDRDANPPALEALVREVPVFGQVLGPLIDALHPRLQLRRVFVNGYTYGQPGGVHTDGGAGWHTGIVYLNPEWPPEYGGDTVFFGPDGLEAIQTVACRPGRIVHFSGDVPHLARSPSRLCPALRAVLVLHSQWPDAAPAAEAGEGP